MQRQRSVPVGNVAKTEGVGECPGSRHGESGLTAVKAAAGAAASLLAPAPFRFLSRPGPVRPMSIPMHHHSLLALDEMSARDAAAMLASARELQRQLRAGTLPPLLRGRNVALLCEAADDPQARSLCHAAAGLGATVAQLRPSAATPESHGDARAIARLLGRLYDVLLCHGVAPALTRRLAAQAGIPVYGSISSPDGAADRLAEQFGDGASAGERRCFVLQAALLVSLG